MSVAASYVAAAAITAAANLAPYWANENSFLFGLSCRCFPKLPRSFHATRTLTGESRRPAPKTYWAFDAFDPRRVITSSWLPTWVLLCTRVALCLYFVAGIAVEVSNGGSQGGSNDFPDWGWLRYFTNWAFAWLLCFQGVLGTALTTYYLRVSCKVTEWNFGLKLLLVIEQVSPSYAMLITVFYWAVLSTGDEEADNIMRHGGNLVVLLVNSMAGDVPFISYHIQFGILFGTLYLIFMWIYHAISGIWVYSALAIEEEDLGSLVYYAVLPILFILCFYVWYGIVALRDLIVYKVCGVSQNRAGIELDSLRSQPQRPGKVVEAQAEK